MRVPRFTGVIAGVLAFCSPLRVYGVVKGEHIPTIGAAIKEARDAGANAAGMRIATVSLSGQRQVSREEIFAAAGVTENSSLLFLDVADARAKLEAIPWIAEATVRKLYPDRLQITVTEREAFALWQLQRQGRGDRRRRHGAFGQARAAARHAALRGRPGRRRARRAISSRSSTSIRRSATRCAPRSWSAERRWNLRLKNGIDVRLPETDIEGALSALARLDREKSLLSPRHHRGRSAPRRSPHGAALGRRRPGARGRAEEEHEEEGGRRVSDLTHGLAPKMKPISRRRSAIVCALDIGTSKIVCAIARLKPRPPQDVLPRRTHAIEVLGIGHTQAQGMKSGSVVDIAAAEEMLRHAVDGAERAAGVHVDSVVLPITAGRTASELFAATVHMKNPTVSDADIERVLAAGSHHSVREGRAVLHSLPIGYALDDNRGIRDPRGMVGQRLGVDMHVATTDVAAARNLTLLVERCHIGVEAMVAAPYVSGLAVLAEDEADLGAAVIDLGAGTTTRRGVLRRPLRACRRLCGRRPARHDGHRARAHHHDRGRRAPQDAVRRGAVRPVRRPRHDLALDRRRRSARSAAHDPARAAGAHHPAARRGDPRNGARQARRVAVRGRSARPRHPRPAAPAR